MESFFQDFFSKSEQQIYSHLLKKSLKEKLIFWAAFKNFQRTSTEFFTAKNTVISPDFLVWKFFRKAQFPHSFGVRNYAETVPFQKISTPGNQVKLRYFLQYLLCLLTLICVCTTPAIANANAFNTIPVPILCSDL